VYDRIYCLMISISTFKVRGVAAIMGRPVVDNSEHIAIEWAGIPEL